MQIRYIDFETTGETGEDAKQALCEVGWCDIAVTEIDPTTGLLQAELGPREGFLVNPGRPMPPEGQAVHHISDEMVAGAPPPDRVFLELGKGFPDYLAAHGADFEQGFYKGHVPWICTYKVALRLWPDLPTHKLQYLRYALDIGIDQSLGLPPHRAVPDAFVGAALMVKIIHEGRASIEDMVRWSKGPALLTIMSFGKHRGKRWDEAPSDYLQWILDKSDLDRDTKANAKHYLKLRDEVF